MNLFTWFAGTARARAGVACIVVASLPLSLGSAIACSGPFDWKQWAVAQTEAMPEVTRAGSRVDQARYLVSLACDKMAELGLAPNDSLADRAANIPRPGSRGTTDDGATGVSQGTCEDVEEILKIVLAAPGLAAGGWRLGVPTSAATHLPPDSWSNHGLNVNRNHVAQGLEIDREIYIFDPWMSSYLESARRASFAEFGGKNEWNGKPIKQWSEKMEELGYDRFQLNLSYSQGHQDFTRPARQDIDEVIDYYLDDLDKFFGTDRSRMPVPGKARSPGTRTDRRSSTDESQEPDITALGAMVQRPQGAADTTNRGVDVSSQKDEDAGENRSAETTLLDLILGPDFALEQGPIVVTDDDESPGRSDEEEGTTEEDKIEPVTLRGTIDPASTRRVVAPSNVTPVTLRIRGNRTATVESMRVTTSDEAGGMSVTVVETIRWMPVGEEAIHTVSSESPGAKPRPVRVDFNSTTTCVARVRMPGMQGVRTAEIAARCTWTAERQPDGNWFMWVTGSQVIKTTSNDQSMVAMPPYENVTKLLLRPVPDDGRQR